MFSKKEGRAWPVIIGHALRRGYCYVATPKMLKFLGTGSVVLILLLLIIGWGIDQEPIEKEPYVVQEGDTLWDIANERWEGDTREGVWWMREENNLESPVILPGQTILVPKKEEETE